MKPNQFFVLHSAMALVSIIPFRVHAQSTVVQTDLAGIQADFNAMQGFTRIIFMGDPTCGGCIGHANDLRNYIFNQCDNPDLRAMIVWAHVSGFPSTYPDAVNQSNLWSDSRVSFYWDTLAPDVAYGFGYEVTWSGCNYNWDFSAVYTDSITWPNTFPPAPYYCMSKSGCCNTYSIASEKNQLTTLGECAAPSAVADVADPSGLMLYPNPSHDFIMLNAGIRELPVTVEVIGPVGQRIAIQVEGDHIDVSSLPPGMYLLRLPHGHGAYSLTFIKY